MKAKTATVIALSLLLGVLAAGCAAFDLGDIIQARTPIGIQKAEGLPARMPVNQARVEYQAWFEDVQREGTQWQNELDKAQQMQGLFEQLGLTALDEFGPTVGGVPVVGPLLVSLLGPAGFVFGRAGRGKEKEESHNAGADRTQRAIIEALRENNRPPASGGGA